MRRLVLLSPLCAQSVSPATSGVAGFAALGRDNTVRALDGGGGGFHIRFIRVADTERPVHPGRHGRVA